MPWRLIGLVLILVIFLVFIGLNLDNRSDISFGFSTLKDVPVYLPIFASFVFGLLCSIPFVISMGLKSKKNRGAKAGEIPIFDIPGMPPPKKRGKGDSFPGDFPNGGPYGID